jgi:hypothetical protein
MVPNNIRGKIIIIKKKPKKLAYAVHSKISVKHTDIFHNTKIKTIAVGDIDG